VFSFIRGQSLNLFEGLLLLIFGRYLLEDLNLLNDLGLLVTILKILESIVLLAFVCLPPVVIFFLNFFGLGEFFTYVFAVVEGV
jgi:hypothetical protein